ncbi:MAG: hypothetical protein V1740_07390 [Candidatus Woesearchaeota archaeon]
MSDKINGNNREHKRIERINCMAQTDADVSYKNATCYNILFGVFPDDEHYQDELRLIMAKLMGLSLDSFEGYNAQSLGFHLVAKRTGGSDIVTHDLEYELRVGEQGEGIEIPLSRQYIPLGQRRQFNGLDPERPELKVIKERLVPLGVMPLFFTEFYLLGIGKVVDASMEEVKYLEEGQKGSADDLMLRTKRIPALKVDIPAMVYRTLLQIGSKL